MPFQGFSHPRYAIITYAGWPGEQKHQRCLANHLGYVEQSLEGMQYLVGNEFSAADVQVSFVGEVAGAFGLRGGFPNLDARIGRLHARPAYQAAIERGGPYGMAN